MHRLVFFWALLLLTPTCLALGEASWLAKKASNNLVLVDKNISTDLIIDADEYPGVLRAAKNLQTDIENVSGKKPTLSNTIGNNNNPLVIVGTLGKSKVIDQLITAKKNRCE